MTVKTQNKAKNCVFLLKKKKVILQCDHRATIKEMGGGGEGERREKNPILIPPISGQQNIFGMKLLKLNRISAQ